MMKKWVWMLMVAVPFVASAAPPAAPPDANVRFERMEKRMRITRVLGLAEVLDLNEAQALKMQETLAKFDDKRRALVQAIRDSTAILNRAASGEQAAQGQVDQAVGRIFDARAQLQQLDREMYQAVSQGLTPQKRARAAVFLSRVAGRFGAGPAMHGREMMRGHGAGMARPEMAPMAEGPGPFGDGCPEECPMGQP